MPVIKPYRITQPRMEDVISFGPSSRTAMYAWLYAFNRWKNPVGVDKYILDNEIRIDELSAWRVIDTEKGYHYLFAVSLRDAAARSGVKRKDILRIQRCDPFFVLFVTPRPVLGSWIKTAWPFTNWQRWNESEGIKLFPKFTYILRTKPQSSIQKETYYRELVNGWAAMLRLAMELPFFAGQNIFKADGDTYRNKVPPMELREYLESEPNPKFLELHAPNIGKSQCHETLAIVGADIQRSRVGYSEVKKALRRFIVAYGYNPGDMSWSEVIALWKGGPVLLEQRKVEISLGHYDKFEDF